MKTLSNHFKIILHWTSLILITSLYGCGGDDPNPIVPIEANFSTNKTSINVGESIKYTDTSTGNPTSWEWTFEGGEPETSVEQNPIVTYKLSGSHTVTLKASKQGLTDTEIKEDLITVECVSGFKSGLSIRVNNVERSFDILLPSGFCNSTDFPVIIDLHGTSSTKEAQRSFSGFDDIANANNIIMVWPQALELTTCLNKANRWNANLISTPDDIGFISALIDKISSEYNVDSKRIYVTGMSNGGFMAYSLACALSNKIAAIASVGGTMTDNLLNNICQPSRAVPILEIHGTADQICNYDGYTNCEGHQASVDDVIAFWRAKGNCSVDYDELFYDNINIIDGCTARILTYQGCSTDNLVKLVIVDGGGHTWPGSEPYYNFYLPYKDYLFPMNFDINASEVIWDFLKEHQLTN